MYVYGRVQLMEKINWILIIILVACLAAPDIVDGRTVVYAAEGIETALLPEIVNFTLSPVSIDYGSSALLIWNVRNAASISIDHDIGGVGMEGQVRVNPLYSTTYKITAMNSAGVRSRYITLEVTYSDYAPGSDTVGCDPVTGRNASVDMAWEQLCLSSQYQVQIARDPGFTLKMYDSGIMAPADATSPAFWLAPGILEAGHTYYWRVRTRQAATGQYLISPWSEPQAFTVSPGYAVRTDYYGLQALAPSNGCTGCPVSPVSFSWSGYPNTTKYRFVLARDAQLQNIVVEAFTTTTSYELKGTLEYDTSYFWQVSAVEPIPSDPSALFTFHTMSAPGPAAPPSATDTTTMPVWALAVIIAGIALIIFAVIMVIKARRTI